MEKSTRSAAVIGAVSPRALPEGAKRLRVQAEAKLGSYFATVRVARPDAPPDARITTTASPSFGGAANPIDACPTEFVRADPIVMMPTDNVTCSFALGCPFAVTKICAVTT